MEAPAGGQWMLSLHLTVGTSSLSLVVSLYAWLSSLLPHLVLISTLYYPNST